MVTVVSKIYEFSDSDIFSRTFAIAEIPMIPSLDGPSLNTLSKVSRFFYSLLEDPLIWQYKAQELGLVFSDARQEVRAFYEMRELKRGTYVFAKALLGTLSPTDFRKIPYIGLAKLKWILIHWPPDATIITGVMAGSYIHSRIHYIAFSVIERSFSREENRVILVTETHEISEIRKNI